MAMPRPTNSELEILDVLWRCGPATVREIHRALAGRRDVGYNSIGKLLQIMVDKGLAERDSAEFAHTFRAAVDRVQVEHRLVGDLADRLFAGSAARLALRAVEEEVRDPAALAEIQRILLALEE